MQKRQVLVVEVNGKDRASTGAVVYFYGCFKALSKAVYNSQPKSGALVFRTSVQAVEHIEYPGFELIGNANAIVNDQ